MDPASAVAGLISLAGLVLEGVQTLRTFCLDYKHAGRDIHDTAADIQSLATVIAQLQELSSVEAAQPSTLTLLRHSIIACKQDVDTWLSAIQSTRFCDKKGVQRSLKRLSAALDWSRRGHLRQKIASHRAQLSLVLELFGRSVSTTMPPGIAHSSHSGTPMLSNTGSLMPYATPKMIILIGP